MHATSNPEPIPYSELVTFDCRACGRKNQYGIAIAHGGPLVIRCECGSENVGGVSPIPVATRERH